MPSFSLDELRRAFTELTEMHGWAPLQTPRSLTLALTGRVGALASLLQFSPDDSISDETKSEMRAELADCLVYLMALSDSVQVNLIDSATERIHAAIESSRPAA